MEVKKYWTAALLMSVGIRTGCQITSGMTQNGISQFMADPALDALDLATEASE